MPTGTSFEADLRAAREAADYSLSDIQQKTRIPVDVLRRFEEGDLVGDPTYNEVYLKAFIQSYAKAVGVSPSAALAGYAEQQAGHYSGSLHPSYEPTAEPPAARRPADPEPAPVAAAPPGVPPAVQALTTAPQRREAPPADERPKTLAQARVNRPAVPTARRSFDKNWGTILGLFAVFVVVLAAALYFLVFAGDDVDETAPDTVAVGATGAETPIDTAGVGAGAAGGGPQLQFPVQVTVTAGGDGLQWFRVTEDGGDRTPYWIDAGASQTFTADSSLVLWGEGNEGGSALAFAESTVEVQGVRFTPRDGAALRFDRQRGQAVLDSVAAAGAAVPAPAAPAPTAVDGTTDL